MRFQSPEILWLLCAIPLLAAGLSAGYFRRRAATRRFGDERLVRQMVVGRSPFLRVFKSGCLLGGLALLVVAAARPQYGGATRLLRRRGIDIVVALDFSKSMLARDAYPSRIELAKRELTTMLAELGGDRVGMIAFAGDAMQYPLTTDYEAAALFLRDLHPNDMPVGGTAIGLALNTAQRLFEGDPTASRRTRVVVLMTDGEDHEGDPVEAARQAAQAGVRIFVLGIGSEANEPIPLYSDGGTWLGYMRDASGAIVTTRLTNENEEQLREIARVARGKNFRAARGQVGLGQIRAELGRLKKRELKARKVTIYEEKFQVFLFPAFLLLLTEAVLGEAVRRRSRSLEKVAEAGRRGQA